MNTKKLTVIGLLALLAGAFPAGCAGGRGSGEGAQVTHAFTR
jgi:hypothetical protein